MTFDEYVYLTTAFIFSYTFMLFLKDYLKNRKILIHFFDKKAFDENSAKNINDLLEQRGNNDVKLMPYVKLFQDQLIAITKDKRLYLNIKKYNQIKRKKILIFSAISAILLLVITLTIWL
jgi:hypothetical protein